MATTASVEATSIDFMFLSSLSWLRAGRNRISSDPGEFGFHLTQLLKQLIELGGPAQLLIFIDRGKQDRARLRKRDDVGGIETTDPGVFPAELQDHALKPILLSLPLAERMGLQQVIDPPRLGRGPTHGNARTACVVERFSLEDL